MFDGNNDGPPDVTERYECATNASRLLLEEHRTGAVDVVIAAGMSPTRIGMSLLRLHSEWSSAAKPKRVGVNAIEALIEQIKSEDAQAKKTAERKGKPYTHPGPVAARAQAEASRWYANELRILATGLKSRATVWEQLAPWAAQKGIDSEVVAAALLYWLSPECPKCSGLKFQALAGTPSLSGRTCPRPEKGGCGGTGHKPHPHGSAKVLAFLDYSVSLARGSLKMRLRGTR